MLTNVLSSRKVFVNKILERMPGPQKDKQTLHNKEFITLLPWSKVCLENIKVDERFKKFPACMELLTSLQVLRVGLYPDASKSSPHIVVPKFVFFTKVKVG